MVWMKLIWCLFPELDRCATAQTPQQQKSFCWEIWADIDVDFRQGASSQEAYHKGKDI